MTEKQAWLYLAERWKNATLDSGDIPTVIINDADPVWPRRGLCGCITDLAILNYIDWKIWKWMRVKITRHGGINDLYKWPLTLEGAKQRVEFCLQQAEKCDVDTTKDESDMLTGVST